MAAVTMAKWVIWNFFCFFFFSFTLEHIWAKYLIPIFKIAKFDLLGRSPPYPFHNFTEEELVESFVLNYSPQQNPYHSTYTKYYLHYYVYAVYDACVNVWRKSKIRKIFATLSVLIHSHKTLLPATDFASQIAFYMHLFQP